ncbi:ATP-binding protein [Microbaculum sp. FT89]|uniref:ATP-binding protein n=1 Tax=Microbaculum sp. FT89 TaxID=3447298 RepID=UPI003F52E927
MSSRLDESMLLRAPGVAETILGAAPAWVWDVDEGRILLASAAGIAFFDESDFSRLAARRFDMERPGMNQLARLGRSLPRDGSMRLSLLRFFVGLRDISIPCQCRLLADVGRDIVLIVAGRNGKAKADLDDRFLAAFAAVSTPLILHGGSGELRRNQPAADLDAAAGERVALALPDGPYSLVVFGDEARAATRDDAEDVPGVDEASPDEAAEAETGEEPATQQPETGQLRAARALPNVRRFTFQLDADGRFVEVGAAFAEIVGPEAADVVGREWIDLDLELSIDTGERVARALETHDTWSNIQIDWPTDYGEVARLRLSALPRFGEGRAFVGYRGFADVLSVTPVETEDGAEAPTETGVEEPPKPVGRPQQPARGGERAKLTIVSARPEEPPARREEPPARLESETDRPAEPIEEPAASETKPKTAEVGGAGSRVLHLHSFKQSAAVDGALNDQERSAFEAIAEALGARWSDGEPESQAAGPETADEAGASEPGAFEPAAEEAEPKAEDLAETVERLAEAPPEAPPEATAELPTQAPVAEAPAEPEQPRAPDLVFKVFDRVPIGLAILRDKHVLAANRAFLDLFEYADIEDLEIAGGIGALIEGRDEDEEPGTAVTARKRDGSTVPVEVRLGRTPWVDGPAMLMSVRTAQPKADARAGLPADEFKPVLDTAFDGVFVLDADGVIQSANARGAALVGVDADTLASKPFIDLVVADDRSAVADLLQGLLEGGVPSVLENGREIALLNGDEPVPVQFSPGRVGTGEPARICVVLRDLTDWKAAEADLVAARKRAEDASAQKSDFLAKMSHEIRTPLNGIIGFSEVILEERFGPLGNDRYREYMKDIRESGEHLMSLVNDLLDLSKVEAGKLQMSFTNLRLNDLVEQCVAVMQPQSNRARIIIRTSLPSGLPGVVADARSIRQVLLNILSNAIKFTPPGGQVIVSTALGETGEVHLRVRDTGVGMSESDVATAMEPFRQLATTPSTGERGTGLGLPLARALTEANRATFNLTSKAGEGTLVEITFPQQRVLAE